MCVRIYVYTTKQNYVLLSKTKWNILERQRFWFCTEKIIRRESQIGAAESAAKGVGSNKLASN